MQAASKNSAQYPYTLRSRVFAAEDLWMDRLRTTQDQEHECTTAETKLVEAALVCNSSGFFGSLVRDEETNKVFNKGLGSVLFN